MLILCLSSLPVHVNTMSIAKLFIDEHLDDKFLGPAVLFSYGTALWSTKFKLILIERMIKSFLKTIQKL